MPVQKYIDGAKVGVKNNPGVWIIMMHETIQKGASTKFTGKVKCRNRDTGEIKFFSENACSPV
ncbi:MAG TPA: hypothetical protein VGN64_21240 [Dyadobacter sp.]|jgi:hypothetical protein|nr:hypothetical protein [Dyadobacter sp.]